MEIRYPFTNPSNYIFDSSKIEVSGSKAKLKKTIGSRLFNQDFSADTGFTYDNSKAEFTAGLLQQKNLGFVNSTAGNDFGITGKDLQWYDGDPIGTLYGGASIISGDLDLPGGVNQYLEYNAADNIPPGNKGAIRFQFIPNYSGAPALLMWLFATGSAVDSTNNELFIYHTTSGTIRYSFYDSTGVLIKTVESGNTFLPTAGQTYEIELNYDLDLGEYRLFINGILLNGLQTSAPGTRNQTTGLIRLGRANTSVNSTAQQSKYASFSIFDTVQHTANYTPGEAYPATLFDASQIDLPLFQYTDPGWITSLDNFTAVESGSLKWIIKSPGAADWKYWDGAAWVVSDGTSGQANTTATMAANISNFIDVSNETDVYLRLFFTNTDNTRSYIDNLDIDYTTLEDYPQDDPTIEGNASFLHDGLEGFLEDAIKSGSDEIKYILKKNADWYYYDGAAWVVSNETYAQSNTATEIQANLSTFTSVAVTTFFRAFLHSDAGTTTPEFDLLTIFYNFSGAEEIIEKCTVWADNNKNSGSEQTPFTVQIAKDFVKYKTTTVIRQELLTITPQADGQWQIELIETDNMEGNVVYEWTINGIKYYSNVPNEVTKNFWDLPNLRRVEDC